MKCTLTFKTIFYLNVSKYFHSARMHAIDQKTFDNNDIYIVTNIYLYIINKLYLYIYIYIYIY